MDYTIEMVKAAHGDFHADEEIFNKLMQDAEKPLHLSCIKFTKLSGLVKLYNRKHNMDGPIKAFQNY